MHFQAYYIVITNGTAWEGIRDGGCFSFVSPPFPLKLRYSAPEMPAFILVQSVFFLEDKCTYQRDAEQRACSVTAGHGLVSTQTGNGLPDGRPEHTSRTSQDPG